MKMILLLCLFALAYADELQCTYQLENARNTLHSLQNSAYSEDVREMLLIFDSLLTIAEEVNESCDLSHFNQKLYNSLNRVESCDEVFNYIIAIIEDLETDSQSLSIIQNLLAFKPEFKVICMNDARYENMEVSYAAQDTVAETLRPIIDIQVNLEMLLEENEDLRKALEDLKDKHPDDSNTYIYDMIKAQKVMPGQDMDGLLDF